eukprot:13481737-Alexandrium_andersonii.AAC.1
MRCQGQRVETAARRANRSLWLSVPQQGRARSSACERCSCWATRHTDTQNRERIETVALLKQGRASSGCCPIWAMSAARRSCLSWTSCRRKQ